jgi:hypothetical protein
MLFIESDWFVSISTICIILLYPTFLFLSEYVFLKRFKAIKTLFFFVSTEPSSHRIADLGVLSSWLKFVALFLSVCRPVNCKPDWPYFMHLQARLPACVSACLFMSCLPDHLFAVPLTCLFVCCLTYLSGCWLSCLYVRLFAVLRSCLSAWCPPFNVHLLMSCLPVNSLMSCLLVRLLLYCLPICLFALWI